MGLFFTKKTESGAQVSVWKIEETEEELLNIISVPQEELEDLLMIRSEARRREKLAVRALLNTIFEDKVYLGHHDNGSPFIQNNPIHISISHTLKYVAIITHPTEEVGVDIESVKRDFTAVEKRALSEEEREDLVSKNRNEQLAIYWSAKEALYKRMSQHGVDFAKQMEIEKFIPKNEGELSATFISKDGVSEDFEMEYEIFDKHVLVWLVG